MPAVIVDVSRAREQLGYRPSVSLLDGLASVWQDFVAHAPQDATLSGRGNRGSGGAAGPPR
jgi:UDP-glucose 4-epimerase